MPGVTFVDWPVADPGGQDEETVRRIIADIDGRVRSLLVELVPDVELPPRSWPEAQARAWRQSALRRSRSTVSRQTPSSCAMRERTARVA